MSEQEVSDGQMFNVADLHARIKALQAENAEHLKIHKMLSEKCNQLDNDLIIMTNQNSIGRHAWKESDNKITELQAEVERLKGIETDHLTDWKRIQDAERKCEAQAAIIEKLESVIKLTRQHVDHSEQCYSNTSWDMRCRCGLDKNEKLIREIFIIINKLKGDL